MEKTWKYKVVNKNGIVEKGKITSILNLSMVCSQLEAEGYEILSISQTEDMPVWCYILPPFKSKNYYYYG